jgi:hypothetical protein
VSTDDPLLDRQAIEEAFRRLGDRLARRGVIADVYVFGGAAMALAYDARRATRDIDAVFQRDAEDIRFLVKHLGLSSAEEVFARCAEIFPDEEVPGRARLVLEDVFGAQ